MWKSLFTALALTLAAASLPASAHEFKKGDMTVEHPWARASAGMAKTGAAYMTVINGGQTPDRLVSVKSNIADRTELHTHLMDNGVMMMRPVNGVDVDPGSPTIFAPGGLHVMFIGLKRPLRSGDKVTLTLTFEKTGSLDVEVAVQQVGSSEPAHGSGTSKHLDKNMDMKKAN